MQKQLKAKQKLKATTKQANNCQQSCWYSVGGYGQLLYTGPFPLQFFQFPCSPTVHFSTPEKTDSSDNMTVSAISMKKRTGLF